MSVTPKNLPKRTRVLSKDLLFQEKHTLTDTQVDIMSYIFNAFVWAMKVNGYIILTTKKFASDLPQIGEKTLDASLRELEKKGLIRRKLVQIPSWGNARVRGIKISAEGMEYNSSLYAPTHQAILAVYQKRIDELMEQLNRKEKEPNLESEALAPKNEPVKKIEDEAEAVVSESENKAKDTVSETKDEAKAVVSETENKAKALISEPKSSPESLEDFAIKIRNRFILTSEPICNVVDGFQKDSTFYINSYGKLSMTSPKEGCLQIKSPVQANQFWKWLFKHQHRVGDIIDFNNPKILVNQINSQYKNMKLNIKNRERWIKDIILIKDKFAIRTKDENGRVFIISDSYNNPTLYDYDACKKYILKLKM